jgi:hypothetical protein
MKARRHLLLGLIFCIAGCSAKRIDIDQPELVRLRAEPRIEVAMHAPEPFSFLSGADQLRMGLTAGAVGALTGGLGGIFVGRHAESIGRQQGEELARASSLQDPALKVKDAFVAALISQFQMTNLVSVDAAFTDDDPKAMQQKLTAPAVLDFRTDDWRLIPVGIGSHYRIIYRIRARFLRTDEGKVLWQGYCRHDGSESHTKLDELTANAGFLLRAKMDQVAKSCAATLLLQFLGHD